MKFSITYSLSLSRVCSVSATTCWIFHQIFTLSVHFSHEFSHNWRILSLNYPMNVKICHQMHKLARKSDELIPPAQHQRSTLLNKFIFSSPSLSFTYPECICASYKRKYFKEIHAAMCGACYVLTLIKSPSLSLSLLLWTIDYCYWEFSSSSDAHTVAHNCLIVTQFLILPSLLSLIAFYSFVQFFLLFLIVTGCIEKYMVYVLLNED